MVCELYIFSLCYDFVFSLLIFSLMRKLPPQQKSNPIMQKFDENHASEVMLMAALKIKFLHFSFSTIYTH